MMTIFDLQSIVNRVKYKPGWSIRLSEERPSPGGFRPYIQVSVDAPAEAAYCPYTMKVTPWKGGKRYLSYHMCRQEVVGACLAAIKDAEMHELHEWFKYKGVSIYTPHLDPDVLAQVAGIKDNLNVRDNAMSMEEGAGNKD